MTEQEHEIQQLLAVHDAKFLMVMEELKQQREDIRRAQEKHDTEMREMNKKIDDNFKTLSNQIHNNFVQTMVGFGAIAAAVGRLVFAAFK